MGHPTTVSHTALPAHGRRPPRLDAEPDWEHVAAVAARNECELLV